MIEISNLLYKEDDNIRSFISDSFNFIYDKDTHISMSWGESKEDDVNYDPLCPETVKMILDDNFIFNEDIRWLFSLNTGSELSFASTLTHAILSIDNVTDEVKKFADMLQDKKVFVEYSVDERQVSSLKNVIKIKMSGIKNIRVESKLKSSTADNVKKLIENGISTSVDIQLSHDKIDDLKEFISEVPENVNIDIMIDEHFTDEDVVELNNVLKNRPFAKVKNSSLKNVGRKYDDLSVEEYSLSTFSCILDFINDSIPLPREKMHIKISDCHNVDDYWNSPQFVKFRNKILKKIEE